MRLLNADRRPPKRVVALAAAVASGAVLVAASAQADFTLTSCGGSNIAGTGSSLQNVAQKNLWSGTAANEFNSADGCPGKVEVKSGRIVIKEEIFFATNKDVIQKKSFGVLEAVAHAMKTLTQIKKVAIEGHTDNKGKRDKNVDLSARRARSVQAWLVAHGVAPERLESKGFGPDRPIADNKTPAGRAQNRRVDFLIIDPPQPPEAKADAKATKAAKADTAKGGSATGATVTRKKVTSKRVTPKGGAPKSTSGNPAKRNAEEGFASKRVTAPIDHKYDMPSPWWVPTIMWVLLAAGVILIMLNYMGTFGDPSNLRLVLGLGLILGGIVTATQYR